MLTFDSVEVPLSHNLSSAPILLCLIVLLCTPVDPSTQAPLPSGFLLGLAKAEPQELGEAERSGGVCFPRPAQPLLSRAAWQRLVPSGGSSTLALPSPASGDCSFLGLSKLEGRGRAEMAS